MELGTSPARNERTRTGHGNPPIAPMVDGSGSYPIFRWALVSISRITRESVTWVIVLNSHPSHVC